MKSVMKEEQVKWSDLTPTEKEQAKRQYLSIHEDVAADGDEYDNEYYTQLLNSDALVEENVSHCTLYRDEKGDIWVLL